MVRELNIDERIEPVQFTLDAKVHKVVALTPEIFKAIQKLGESQEDKDADTFHILCQQLALYCGCKTEDFQGTDLRKLHAAIKFVTDTVSEQLGVDTGNPTKPEPPKPPK